MGAIEAVKPDATRQGRLRKVMAIVCLTLGVAYVAKSALGDRLAPGPSPSASVSKDTLPWIRDEATALAKAGVEGKPVMIDFRADWCANCLKLEKETFPDPAVGEETKRFVLLKADCTDTEAPNVKAIQKKYSVVGLPTIAFIDSTGQHLSGRSITGFVTPKALVAAMREVK